MNEAVSIYFEQNLNNLSRYKDNERQWIMQLNHFQVTRGRDLREQKRIIQQDRVLKAPTPTVQFISAGKSNRKENRNRKKAASF